MENEDTTKVFEGAREVIRYLLETTCDLVQVDWEDGKTYRLVLQRIEK